MPLCTAPIHKYAFHKGNALRFDYFLDIFMEFVILANQIKKQVIQMLQVNVHEAKTNLSKLIQKVVNGEEVVIAKRNQPIVKLVLIEKQKPKRRLGTAKGTIKIAADFDAPLEDFKEYIQ